MQVVDWPTFEAARWEALSRFGRVLSGDAAGFQVDLHDVLERADLTVKKVRWTGDIDCGFVVTVYDAVGPIGSAWSTLRDLLDSDLSYNDDGGALAVVATRRDQMDVAYLTWNPSLGVVTVCLAISGSPEPTPET